MKKKKLKDLYVSLSLFAVFILWTVAICFIDTKAIGPNGSVVGFSSFNNFVHKLTGVHMPLYYITDWLGLVPIFVVLGFALLGLAQWIKRKSLRLVDYSIFILGAFYISVLALFVLFETVSINYRPILINGVLETSYPSSTTLLVLTVMPTAIMQFKSRIKNAALKKALTLLISAFIIFMVAARIISGVHWYTDIIGGVLLSLALVMAYRFLVNLQLN